MYRLEVSGLYPIDPWYYDLTNGRPRPRLFITTHKHTPEAIAQIIHSRFLQRYLPIYAACQAKQRELAEAERQQAAFNLKQERLHHAAPDLLAALQELLFYAEIHTASDRSLDLSEYFEAARSAIASATDDTPAT